VGGKGRDSSGNVSEESKANCKIKRRVAGDKRRRNESITAREDGRLSLPLLIKKGRGKLGGEHRFLEENLARGEGSSVKPQAAKKSAGPGGEGKGKLSAEIGGGGQNIRNEEEGEEILTGREG